MHPHKNAIPLAVTHEAWLVVFGLALSYILLRTDIVARLALFTTDSVSLVSFGVGIFFTSILTTTPAIVVFAELGAYVEPWRLALIGGVGAVCGDLVIFRFIQSPLAQYIVRSASNPRMRRMGSLIARGPLWWVVPMLGALIIASPIPDELGLIMMGLSNMRLFTFIPLAYVMNALGIFIIASTGQALL